MLVAETLLSLLLGEESGSVRQRVKVPEALGAAVVADLALLGLVTYDPRGGVVRPGSDAASVPGDPLLARAQELIGAKPLPVSLVVGRLARRVAPDVEARVRQFDGEADEVTGVVRAVLVDDQEPDTVTAVLVTLLAALEQAERVVDHPGRAGSAIAARARAVAASDWGDSELRHTVLAAVDVAVAAPFTAAIDRVIATRA